MQCLDCIGPDVCKKTISYFVKDGSGSIHAEEAIPATQLDIDNWMKTLIVSGLPVIPPELAFSFSLRG